MNHLLTLAIWPAQTWSDQFVEAAFDSDLGTIIFLLLEMAWVMVTANYLTIVLASAVLLIPLVRIYGLVGGLISSVYSLARDAILRGKAMIDDHRSAPSQSGTPEVAASSDGDASADENTRTGSASETNQVVTIDSSEDPPDRQAVTNAFISLARAGTLVDLYCVSTDTDAVLPNATDKESSQIYVVQGDGITTSFIKETLSGAYPDSYLIQTEPIHQEPLASSDEHGNVDDLATVEYKCVGSEWTEDTLTPLTPAVKTSQTSSLGVRKTPPLSDAFSFLADSECTAAYHVAIRASGLSSSDLKRLKTDYENGKLSAPAKAKNVSGQIFGSENDDGRDPTQSDRTKTTEAPESAEYADDIDAITQASFVELDPRFIITGPEASDTAITLASQFESLNGSACTIDGSDCSGLRAWRGYNRAFGPDESGIRTKIRSKLRSPQWRLPAIKRLTRNQSTRFIVSEYALPHFISMEATTEGDTGGPATKRRPPTVPTDPPNRMADTNSDD